MFSDLGFWPHLARLPAEAAMRPPHPGLKAGPPESRPSSKPSEAPGPCPEPEVPAQLAPRRWWEREARGPALGGRMATQSCSCGSAESSQFSKPKLRAGGETEDHSPQAGLGRDPVVAQHRQLAAAAGWAGASLPGSPQPRLPPWGAPPPFTNLGRI